MPPAQACGSLGTGALTVSALTRRILIAINKKENE